MSPNYEIITEKVNRYNEIIQTPQSAEKASSIKEILETLISECETQKVSVQSIMLQGESWRGVFSQRSLFYALCEAEEQELISKEEASQAVQRCLKAGLLDSEPVTESDLEDEIENQTIKNPLSVVAYLNQEHRVRELLDAGLFVDTEDVKGETALIKAIKRGNKGIVSILIDRGAGVNHQSIHVSNVPPLFMAFGYRNMNAEGFEIVKMITEAGADVNLKASDVDFMQASMVISHLKSVDEKTEEILIDWVKRGLQMRDMDGAGNDLIHYVALKKMTKVLDFLIDNAANLQIQIDPKNNDGETPLYFTVLSDVLADGDEQKRLHCIHELVKAGADVDVKVDGTTLLGQAVLEGGLWRIEDLVCKYAADVHVKTEHLNHNLLHYAATNDDSETIRFLLDYDIGVNAPDADGLTPLHMAARYAAINVLDLLLEAGADFNALANRQNNLMHVAIEGKGNVAMIERLLELGMSELDTNEGGQNSVELARIHQKTEIIQFFDQRQSLRMAKEEQQALNDIFKPTAPNMEEVSVKPRKSL